MIDRRVLSMRQNAGLYGLPQNPLTGDLRQILASANMGGALTAGLPGLATPYGYSALQALGGAYGGRQQIAVTLANDPSQQMLLTLHPSDVHVLEEIDTFIAGYSPAEFRADEAVPIIPTPQLTDYFRTFTENNAFKQVPVLASTQSDINEVDPETTLDTYQCIDRALGGFVPTVTQFTARKAFDPMQALARRINWALGLDREVRVFGSTTGLLVATANWNANNVITIAPGSEWDTSLGNPIKNLQDAELRSVMPISAWWMSPPSMNAFLRNEFVRSHMRQLLGDNAPSPDVVAKKRDILIPGLAPIRLVPGKVLNETTGNIDFIMTDRVVGTHTPEGGNINPEDIQTAVTWRFDGPSGTGFITRQFDMPRRGLHAGTMMVSGYSEDVAFIANNVGALVVNTLA
jgi:hypothetical protein